MAWIHCITCGTGHPPGDRYCLSRAVEVQRYDDNPANSYTFGRWVFITSLPLDAAEDYIRRASGPSQNLRIWRR